MFGKTYAEILDERQKAIVRAKELIGEDVEVIDSLIQTNPDNVKPLLCLRKSLELLATANVVYFVRGWNNARSCRIENQCAKEYGGLEIIEE